MKRIITTVFLCFFGMAVFAQNMSYYTSEYMRPDGSFADRLVVLEQIRDAGITTGLGEFSHEALKFLLLRDPDIRNNIRERDAAERSAIILCQWIGAEKVTAAAPELWQTVENFSITRENRPANDPLAMQAALIALGQVDGRDFLPQIVQRLNDYNTQTVSNANRPRVQAAVIGCISALEALKDISGYRPVFDTAIRGSYEPNIRQIAFNALPNIVDDPGEIISEIIADPSIKPDIKYVAWNEMLKTRAPNSSKAKVAATALATGWFYQTSNRTERTHLSNMRKSAINIIRQFGVADDSVYGNLDLSFSRNYPNAQGDDDEIMETLSALATIGSEQAVELLLKYLHELHGRRRSGPWRDREVKLYQWVVPCIGATKTNNADVRLLLTTITRANEYTPYEQSIARNALNQLGN